MKLQMAIVMRDQEEEKDLERGSLEKNLEMIKVDLREDLRMINLDQGENSKIEDLRKRKDLIV